MSDREQAEEAAAAWITRRDAGPWSGEDAAAFDAWLAASLHHRVAYYRLHAAWKESGRLAALQPQGNGAPVMPLHPPPHRFARRHLALAAGLLLALGAGLALYWQQGLRGQDYATVVGGLTTVPLPDGSQMTLNTDSSVRVQMQGAERRIELRRGEVFFEVAKDPSRPFVVTADDVRVIAVGTAFSVNREAAGAQVVVTEGRVRVDLGRAGLPPASLDAGSQLHTAQANPVPQRLSAEQLEQRLSWRSGLVVFRDTPLVDAIAQINRYNTRKIVLDDPRIAQLGVGGVFRATDQQVFLKLLESGFPVRAVTEENQIRLLSR